MHPYTPRGYFKRHIDLSSLFLIVRVKRDGSLDLRAPVHRMDAVSNRTWADRRLAELVRTNPTNRYTIVEPRAR